MKNIFSLLLVSATAFCLYAESLEDLIVLTQTDVDKASVRVITQPTNKCQNLVIQYVGKSSAEIKGILDRGQDVGVFSGGKLVAKTDLGCGALRQGTNYIGLVLVFSNYEQAKLAEKALQNDP